MNTKTLETVALVAGAFAAFVGLWGLVAPSEDFAEAERWIAVGILAAAVSAISATLARRGSR